MKLTVENFKSIFSLDSVLYVSMFILILTVPAIIALIIKIPITIYDSKTSFHIEGNVESISFSQATIKNLDKPLALKFDCNCEITKAQLQNVKYLSAYAVEDGDSYKVLVLTLDGKNVYDKIDLKGLVIGLTIFLLIALACLAIIKLFNRKENNENRKHWEEISRLIEIVRPKFEAFRKPALRLLKTPSETISRFGGKPLVENIFVWPENNGKPMAFLAQIDLAEMSAEFQFDWLPQKGLLLFFYDVIEMPWGYDPKHRNCWKVIYQSQSNHIADFPVNFDKKRPLKESYLQPKRVDLLPDFDDIDLESLGFSGDDIDAYIEISNESDNLPKHQLGGVPSPIQSGMMNLQTQLVSNGIYVGDGEIAQTEEVIKLKAGADDWKLLFQFDSDEELGAIWGDAGMIYFWVQAEKAKKGEFDNCWLILQC